jgi:hypothetical protein
MEKVRTQAWPGAGSFMAVNVLDAAARDRSHLWLRFVVRALVVLWGACLVYFVTASSLGGLTEPREVLMRLLVVGGIASLLLLGLVVVVWRSERMAAWLLFGLAAVLALLMIVSSVLSTVALMGSSQPLPDPWALLGVNLVNLVLLVGPLVGTGWLLLTSARIVATQERASPAPRGVLALGLVLLALTLAVVLLVVISNMLWIADHDAPWLLWINYAFLLLVAGMLTWQFWEAWSGTRTAPPHRAG